MLVHYQQGQEQVKRPEIVRLGLYMQAVTVFRLEEAVAPAGES